MEKTLFWRTLSSTTFWFNLITGIIGILALPEVIAIIPNKWLEFVAVVNPIGNFLIRQFLTATPITRSAARRARVKAGMHPNDTHLNRRMSDPIPLPEELKDATPKRRHTDTSGHAPVGRTVTETSVVKTTKKHKPAKKKRKTAPKKPFKIEGRDYVTRNR